MTAMRENIEHVASTSADLTADRLEALKDLIPEAFVEGRIDVQRLREALGEIVDDRPERYTFSWAGRRDALRLLQTPSRATLVPVPDESVEWDTTRNVFIEGENLDVAKLLYKAYAGTAACVYLDVPYNTGRDFIYDDNYADPLGAYLVATGQRDAEGNVLSSKLEASGRFHSRWLSMMLPRLHLARQLMREDAVICISIDDHEVHHLRMLMNEVFGEENFITTVIWQRVYAPKNTAKFFSEDHDYVVIYARNAAVWRPNLLPRTEEANARYSNPDNDRRGEWKPGDLSARNYYSQGQYTVTSPTGATFSAPHGRYWSINEERFRELEADGRIWWGESGSNMPQVKQFLTEVRQGIVPRTIWSYKDVGHTQEAKQELLRYVAFEDTDNVFDTPKPTKLIQQILRVATKPVGGDLVVDLFAGSGTTGHAVMKQNAEDGGDRRFLCVQYPEMLPVPEAELRTIADVAKQRLSRASKEFREASQGTFDLRDRMLDVGFRVYRLGVSHFRDWSGVPERDAGVLVEEMELFANDPVGDAISLLTEIVLREGYPLDCRFINVTGNHANQLFRVEDELGGRSFHVTLDQEIHIADIDALHLGLSDLLVCRDTALTDELAANLALQVRLKTV